MPTTTTIRPNATTALGPWTVTGAANAHTALSDDASGTYVQAPVQFDYPGEAADRIILGLPLPTIPVGRQITRVRLRAKGAGTSPILLSVAYVQIKLGANYGSETLTHYQSVANTEVASGWMSTKPGGGQWTAADIDSAQVEAWVYGGTPTYRLTEIYVDVEYTDAPNAPTGVLPASGQIVTTDIPNLKAVVNPSATRRPLIAQWQLASDSGFTTNLRTVTIPADQALIEGNINMQVPDADQLFQGTWWVRARWIDDLGSIGAWSVATSFTVTHAPTTTAHTPQAGRSFLYGTGVITFGWTFSDPSTVDYQTAYQIVVERNDTGTAVLDTGKIVSTDPLAAVTIPVGMKDIPLRWRIRVWDSDDVAGAYSANLIFTVSDAPVVNITAPVDASTVADPAPLITWTFTGTGRYQTSYMVRIYKVSNGEMIYDSGIVRSDENQHELPGPTLLNDTSYNIEVTLTDNLDLNSAPDVNLVNVHWDPPASPSFVVVP